jgi:hypothetical protein
MPVLLRHTLTRLLLPCLLALSVASLLVPRRLSLDRAARQCRYPRYGQPTTTRHGQAPSALYFRYAAVDRQLRRQSLDYFYSLKNGNNEYSRERLTLYFTEDVLTNMQGNFRPEQATAAVNPTDAQPDEPEEEEDEDWDISKWWD